MGNDEKTIYYMELQSGDAVQDGDQWLDSFGQWQPYVCNDQISGVVFSGVKARRPIRATHQTTFEEVPGSRTSQQAVDQPQRERIAYEELRVGDHIQNGDQWQNDDGRWQLFSVAPIQVRQGSRVRRPYKISAILEIGDALANTQKAATQLQDERDEARNERDLARAEVARLSTELWARKPLEDRVAALTDEVAQLRAERQEWIDRCNAESVRALRLSEQLSAAEVAVKSAQRARDELQRQVDELRADRRDEVTARQVQEVLRRWATELDWSADCFVSGAREQIHGVQNTLIAVMQRIESMIDAEGSRAND